MSFRPLPPRMRQIPARKSAILSILDVGASKIVCLIARLTPMEPSDALRGRTHRCKVLGIGHQRSNGVKGGAIVDLQAAEHAARLAIDAAERMAGVEVGGVIVNMSGGLLSSQRFSAKVALRGKTVSEHDIHRVLEAASAANARPGRSVLHALPTSYSLDATADVRDPKGMIGEALGVDLHVASCESAAARNLMLVVERCHLNVEAMAASPYVAGLSVLTDDEADLGAAVVEMGAGTTTMAIYSGGRFIHASGFAVGGQHITMDLARGLSACIADAERIKTLYGTVLTGGSDARELMSVPTAGDNEPDVPQIVSRATIGNIVRHRAEEIFEMVRDRLADSPFAAEPKARVVLSGGAAQLTGLVELATRILNRPVRLGRPLGFGRLPSEAKTASFAVPAGLLVYPQYAHLEHVEPRHTRQLKTGTDGYFGKVGRWLREGF